MASQLRKHFLVAASLGLALGFSAATSLAQESEFKLTSSTFSRGEVLPIRMIYNNPVNGVNTCSLDGSTGGNESPELSWTGVPRGTTSFVVVLYDETASFTHWGIYNISGDAHGLPQNAGVSGSTYGSQILNDFGVAAEYDGPCPPAGVVPYAHHYVFTVYALCHSLTLQDLANFPANAETLYHALIAEGKTGSIRGTASLGGYYSTTPTQ
jgi:Raf kinase inhibitor-like YbhB/YbcL family protein